MNFESGGGTERVTSVIANELVKKNFDVRIISCQHGNSCKFEIDKNIKLYSLNGEKCENSALRKIYVEKQLIKYVKEEQIDIMISVTRPLSVNCNTKLSAISMTMILALSYG